MPDVVDCCESVQILPSSSADQDNADDDKAEKKREEEVVCFAPCQPDAVESVVERNEDANQ